MQTNDPVQGTATMYPAFLRRASAAALTAAIAMMAAGPAAAFQFEVGPLKGNLDNTLSYGMLWRAQGRSDHLVGIANGDNPRASTVSASAPIRSRVCSILNTTSFCRRLQTLVVRSIPLSGMRS